MLFETSLVFIEYTDEREYHMMGFLTEHEHGKSKVRLGRTWRDAKENAHYFVEWEVCVRLISPEMEKAYTSGDNGGMTTTDTTRNMCYVVAQRCKERTSMEEYAIRLARTFIETYPLIDGVSVTVDQAPWERAKVRGGVEHSHGFTFSSGIRTCFVNVMRERMEHPTVTSGLKDYRVLKTTQSGYEGYIKDKFTKLGETNERILATAIDCVWTYDLEGGVDTSKRKGWFGNNNSSNNNNIDYDLVYQRVLENIKDQFFGDAQRGVYSPSVQATLYNMGDAIVNNIKELKDVKFTLPNIHFIPMTPNGGDHKFNDDVYIATSEPHGTIAATVSKRNETAEIRSRL